MTRRANAVRHTGFRDFAARPKSIPVPPVVWYSLVVEVYSGLVLDGNHSGQDSSSDSGNLSWLSSVSLAHSGAIGMGGYLACGIQHQPSFMCMNAICTCLHTGRRACAHTHTHQSTLAVPI